jgi:hypothetical protein
MRRFAYRGTYRASKKQLTGVIEAEDRSAALKLLSERAIQVTNLEDVADASRLESGRIRADILPSKEPPKPAPAPPRARQFSPAATPPLSGDSTTDPKAGPARIDFGLVFDAPALDSKTKTVAKKKKDVGLFGDEPLITSAQTETLLLPARYHKRLIAALLAGGGLYFTAIGLAALFAKPAYNPKAPLPPPPPPYRVEITGYVELPPGVHPYDLRVEFSFPEIDFKGGAPGGLWSTTPGKIDAFLKLPRKYSDPLKLTKFNYVFSAAKAHPVRGLDLDLEDKGTFVLGQIPYTRLVGF